MSQTIIPATIIDLEYVLGLFEKAIQYQKENKYIGWQSMDKEFIETDIHQGLLYKVVSEEKILGVFCVCFVDKLIWRNRENGDAIYLHRIVLNREYAGAKVFRTVFDWAINYSKMNNLKYVRMDTWAGNSKLIDYYKKYGFRFIENYTTEDTKDLPVQHRNLTVALLEFEVR